jgi:hypothetical protein
VSYETASVRFSGGRGFVREHGISWASGPPAGLRHGPAPATRVGSASVLGSVRNGTGEDFLDCIGVHPGLVPDQAVRTVELVRCFAIRTLGLPSDIRCLWYRPCDLAERPRFQTRRSTLGWHRRGELDRVWIKVAPANSELVNTVAHELRHAYQALYGHWQEDTEDARAMCEDNAEGWANAVASHIVFATSGIPLWYD